MSNLMIENKVEFGPLVELGQMTAGLDFYKPNMSQLAYEIEPDVEVEFSFYNRGEQRLLDYVDPEAFKQRLDALAERGLSESEVEALASIANKNGDKLYSAKYLEYLITSELPKVNVRYDAEIDDIAIDVIGPWALSTFWETVVMAELNEAYFEGFMIKNGINPFELYEEGDKRLDQKIEILKANPDIKIAEFGTRRHFSLRWQKHVTQRLINECPENIIGTSNVALANSLGVKPIGTFAHEMPMVYAALADARGLNVRESHNRFLDDWFDLYGENLSVALTDTFTTEFFFSDFTEEQAKLWKGVRHDSGDPIEFGEKLISFYEENGIDPKEKSVVFSDGLDIDSIVMLHEHFKGRINMVFGWGTTLSNDLGLKSLNVVMKARRVFDGELEAGTVKLSDNIGKNMGSPELVREYKEVHFKVGKEALSVGK